MSAAPNAARSSRLAARAGPLLLAGAILASLWIGTQGITRETSYFHEGDSARYLMNGVFLTDLVSSGTGFTPSALISYAERYYARYPALSLGHHPPLVPASLVPFLAVFGVSVFAARVAMLCYFVLCVWLLYKVGSRMYDPTVGGWAALLLATSPNIAYYARRILSELPTLACVLLAVLFIEWFRRSGRLRDYMLFIVAAVASLLCRPTAIYMAPAYLLLLLRDGGHLRLRETRVATITLLGLVVCALAAVGYLLLSPFNSGVVANVLTSGVRVTAVTAMVHAVASERALFVTMLVALLAALLRRDRRVLVPLSWVVAVLASAIVVTGSISPARYAIPAVPAICIIAASLVARTRTSLAYVTCTLVLLGVTAWQLFETSKRPMRDAPGYEAAARYIADRAQGTVLYSASVDVGYFVFFVRKHDAEGRIVVLRADKLLTTSLMNDVAIEDRIERSDEIVPLLQEFGTRFVVIEDRPSGSRVLDWLRDVVRTDQFVERRRFPVGEAGAALDGVSVVVYEYLAATPPAAHANVDLNLPLIGRRIRIPLTDLLATAAPR